MESKNDTSHLLELLTCGITYPGNSLLQGALDYSKQHTSPSTVNHCCRAAAYALLCCSKLPHLAGVDKDLVIFACIFHDLGWATTESLISKDKRFEVDGANIARDWVRDLPPKLGWDNHRIQLAWDAIALHTTPSIAQHKEPEVAAVNLGIMADFVGPHLAGGLVTMEEHMEIIRAFPRLGFHDQVVGVLCSLCKVKPETTYDNFVGEFGAKYGLDGHGEGQEEFARKLQENKMVNRLMGALKACEEAEARSLV